jgi:lipopolysaccharide export system protein LptC
VSVDGPVHVVGPDGYSLATHDVQVDLDKRTMQSRGAVNGTMKLGQFQAGSLAPISTSGPSAWTMEFA